jgi:hypothetical protein
MEGDGRRREFEWLCVAYMGSFNSIEDHVDIWPPGIFDAELWCITVRSGKTKKKRLYR